MGAVMANEVSCKVFGTFFEPLQAKGVALETMVEGTTISVARLRDKKERMDWAEMCQILKNVHPHFTDEERLQLGRNYLRSPGMRFGMVIARLMFQPMDFYRWMNKPREGLGNQMFTCVTPSHKELSPNHIQMELTVPEGYEPCWDFFVLSAGNMMELPCLLGLPESKVTLTRIPRGARFDIIVPLRTPLFARVWRVITWPFTIRSAAKELKEAHETLLYKYEELEAARVTLDIQATRLRTAHTISDVIHNDLDLTRTARSIATALVEQAHFAWAEISVAKSDLSAHFGAQTDGVMLEHELTTKSGPIGTLRVQMQRTADMTEREELLAFVKPTLELALQNALAYQELSEYKAGLEKLVEQRTSELRKAHDELASMVTDLRDAQAAREKFFGNISHEIRTPLSLILLAAADIERRSGGSLDERSRAGLASVNDAARKLVRLVDELLLLAAGQEGKLVIAREPTDLAAMLKQIVNAWRPVAEAAGLDIAGTLPARFVASVDPVALERVVSNLVSNAVKYTPRGGHIELQLAVTTEHVRISVLDTGPGIDAELAQRLFGRFERSQGGDRRKTGTGIGLALVKQLSEAHGGTVEAIARPTGGTELRVLLPASIGIDNVVAIGPTTLRTHHAPAVDPSAVTSGTVFRPSGLSAGTILVAEDQPALAESIARLLCDQYTVVVALDGNAALELVKQHEPQLLITDVEMPGMTGIELAAKFRETTERVAPIIILSAVIDLRTRVAGLEAGAIDYVSKPFDPAELKARVQSQFRMRDLAARLQRAEQLSSMGILTSGLAHELRNPANGIVNAIAPLTELLPEELIGPETDAGQLIDAMRSSAEQIAFLVRQLLGFRNNGRLELRPSEAPALVQRAVALAKNALVGVDVRTDLTIDRRIVCAAPLLVQVLANLVENAGHAAGRGGWVAVRATSVDGRVLIEITDSGAGVPIELRERIFEPFFTTKAPGKGTGLGLSVARAIAHRHNGTLELREVAGRTAFVLDVPAESTVVVKASAV
jgi:signal transduction histidine kinase